MAADPDRYPGAGQEQFATNKALALYRDATYVLAHAIDRLIRQGIDPSDGEALLETIQTETNFEGLTGNIRLKRTGDRFATHDILNIRDSSFELKKIGWATEEKLVIKKKAIFSDGTAQIPDAAERIYVHWDDVEAILMMALFSLGTIVTLVCLAVMMIYRSSPIMNYSSPRFVFGTAVGVLIGFANVFVWTGEPCSATCQARPWLLMLNFVFIFGHMYAKAFRFLYVMKKRKTLQFRPIPDIQLFLCVFFYLLVFAIPVVVWTAAFPLDVTRSDNNPDNDKVNIICNGENAEVFWALLLGLGGISLVVGVLVAFFNQNYHDFFSEATYIGYTMFTVCVTCCVVLPMLFILSDTPHAFYIVLMLGIFLGNGAVLVFMFFPKIWIITHPDKNQVPLDSCGGLKTKKSSSGSII
uniref:G-protein coupled receptors family 3 profile domain-containing protein n=1 Tax=Paramoeba aestuarina TaxID=180227 RepID=A0A7S4P819_9EUKA|mmetsp:Transcript_37826/g.59791  ORF Transcript_37826/g.59791 Transcript_37826/m.59791 type:complete len:412 (+) Transcript_37826:1132-2367(+)